MSLSNKIKALLRMQGKKNKDLSEYLGLTMPQSLNNKFKRCSFSADDLIMIAAFVDCELAFILPDGQIIRLDLSDVRKKATKTEAGVIEPLDKTQP